MSAILSGYPSFSCYCLRDRRTYPVKVKYLQTNQRLNALEVVRQVHQAHTHLGARRTNTAQEDTAHIVFHRTKDMLDPRANARFLCVAQILYFSQRFVAIGTFMNLAFVPTFLDALLLFVWAIGAIRPHFFAACRRVAQHRIEHLTVVYAGVGTRAGSDELGVFVDVDVVIVTIMVLPAFLRLAGITVFLRHFVRGLATIDRYRVFLDNGVVLASIALDGHRNKGGINNLTALEFDPHRSQRLVQSVSYTHLTLPT